MILTVEGVDLDVDWGVRRFEFNRRRGAEIAKDRTITRANGDIVSDKALEKVV